MPKKSATEASKRLRPSNFVFLNCPFDDEYKPIFDALVFTVHACGFRIRCAREDSGTDAIRIHKIITMIKTCALATHDLSRVDTQGQLPRFNMSLELGIFVGARAFGSYRDKRKKYLVLEAEKHQYLKFISDISGQDVRCHNDRPEDAVKAVRQWLSDLRTAKKDTPGKDRILLLYRQFTETLPGLLDSAGQDADSMTFKEFRRYVQDFIAEVNKVNHLASGKPFVLTRRR